MNLQYLIIIFFETLFNSKSLNHCPSFPLIFFTVDAAILKLDSAMLTICTFQYLIFELQIFSRNHHYFLWKEKSMN